MRERARKTYRKPEITQVKLVPEEAVLGGCKSTSYPASELIMNNVANC